MAINYPNLRCCIEAHPTWPAATDAEIATWVNTENAAYSYRPVDAPSRDMWNVVIQYDDYELLTDGQRDVVKTTLFGGGNQIVDVSDNSTPTSTMLIRVFPAGSDTRTALLNAFTYNRSPGNYFEVGGVVNEGHVVEARTYPACGS